MTLFHTVTPPGHSAPVESATPANSPQFAGHLHTARFALPYGREPGRSSFLGGPIVGRQVDGRLALEDQWADLRADFSRGFLDTEDEG